ncbi:hypothetical protein SUGI_0133810 [Cryptomeria japonica]|uniref:uncharacterized protein LOC131063276 n=1 Tax=Cryptomeria japonica TaxID=3369 RepID=UPI002408C744|nr:uncharacterized protein LOC131063276 [Cryptomeria japonica]GLJ10719.1 hypothetical protein SUGI_0133810 [Cryptomeria japonica]
MVSERIPQFVAFKGPNNKYLGYSKNGEYSGHLKFCYDDLTSPFVKHEIVEAGNGYAHIKCCYNNRFWGNREDLGGIVAGEHSPNHDLSSQSCTLFDLSYEDTASNKVSLGLLQNKYVVYKEQGGDSELEGYLFAGEDKVHKNGSFKMYDVGSTVKLPKFVAFKGSNGRFLGLHDGVMQFYSSDLGDDSIRQQVEDIGDGKVKIVNLDVDSKRHWIVYDNWLMLDYGGYEPAVFRPIQIDAQKVALKCVDPPKICRLLTDSRGRECFGATATSLEAATYLTVVETVFSRRVHSIIYDLNSAHIYDLEPLALAKGTAVNTTSQSATMEIGLEYTERRKKSWSNSNSFQTGVSTIFDAGIPFVGSVAIQVSVEDTFTWEWGGEEEQSTTIPTKYTAVVEPGKTVEVVLQATRGKCDVKFSYVQEDLLSTGEKITTSCEDGVFKGINYFDIRFISKGL